MNLRNDSRGNASSHRNHSSGVASSNIEISQHQEAVIIYDIGANNGDDIPYYLKKADVVVAVEANPDLCRHIRERFPGEVQDGRLVVENCVLTAEEQGGNVPFYVHKTDHVLSQFLPPQSNPQNYERCLLAAKSVDQLFRDHGLPYYVKIDIEGYDHVLLRSIFDHHIIPPYISVESHSVEVPLLLTTLGGYRLFKLVDGHYVSSDYQNHLIHTKEGQEVYSFPYHSAGPFGEDVSGPWFDSASLFRRLHVEGLGWKDIHAKLTPGVPQNSGHRWLFDYWYKKILWFTVEPIRKTKLSILKTIWREYKP